MAWFARCIGWLLRTLGITFDIKELFLLIVSRGGSGVVISTWLGLSSDSSVWFLVVLFFVLTCFITVAWQVVQIKVVGDKRIDSVPSVLRKIYKRTRALAEQMVHEGLDEEKVVKVTMDMTEIGGLQKTQLPEIKSDEYRLNMKAEARLLKLLEDGLGRSDYGAKDLPPELRWAMIIGWTMDKHNTGITNKREQDFRFRVLNSQLDAFRPLPTKNINDAVQNALNYIYGGNSLLIYNLYHLPKSKIIFSPKVGTKTLEFVNRLDDMVEKQVVTVKELIKEYIKQNDKRKH